MLRDKSRSYFIKNVFLYRGKGGVNYLSTVKENLNKKKGNLFIELCVQLQIKLKNTDIKDDPMHNLFCTHNSTYYRILQSRNQRFYILQNCYTLLDSFKICPIQS